MTKSVVSADSTPIKASMHVCEDIAHFNLRLKSKRRGEGKEWRGSSSSSTHIIVLPIIVGIRCII